MRYRLRDELSACVIGDHAVFLDVDADRYFRLPPALEGAFLAYAEHPLEAPAPLLLEHGILVPSAPTDDQVPEPVVPPLRSVLEMPRDTSEVAPLAIPEVLATLLACRRALRIQRFAQVLEKMTGYRDRRCAERMADATTEEAMLRAARLFLRARPFIPIAPCCLPDSLALSRFLARRGLSSRLVIGVMGEPFSAHCWVQVGDLALNETVGYARAHTVIRVL